jgi:hypothetical protein
VNTDARRSRLHPTPRRLMVLVVAGTIALTAACGDSSSDKSATASTSDASHPATDPGAVHAPSDSSGAAPGSAATQLTVDPCTLLTVPEIEAAIGAGVERGGLGDDSPGRCTFSVHGDVGAGVVGISVDEPYLCGPLLKALESGSLDASRAVEVAVGDGGVVEPNAGSIQFAVGGGCVGIVGSKHGRSLGQDALVALATSAAGRVG